MKTLTNSEREAFRRLVIQYGAARFNEGLVDREPSISDAKLKRLGDLSDKAINAVMDAWQAALPVSPQSAEPFELYEHVQNDLRAYAYISREPSDRDNAVLALWTRICESGSDQESCDAIHEAFSAIRTDSTIIP